MPDISPADLLAAYGGYSAYPDPSGGTVAPGDVLSALGGPWLARAQEAARRDAEAYQRGGVRELMADTGETQGLAGGFGGITKGPIVGVGRPYRPGPLFDYSQLAEVPSVPQFNLPRAVPPQGVPEATQALASPKNLARVNEAVRAGEAMGGREWYNTEPLRQEFMSQLGEEQGNAAFRQYMDMVAANSPRTRVPENIRNASYFYGLAQRGEELPRTYLEGGYHRMVKETQAPSPYGVMPIHVQNMENALQGGLPVLQNPKPASFVENLAGNQMPVTIDTHNMRLLTGAREAEVPKANEYGFLERLQQQEAAKMGMSPAQYQASAWIGGGKETGLGSPTDPFLRVLEDRVAKTAERHGVSKAQALREFITAQRPLLGVGLTMGGVLQSQMQPAPPE